MLSPKQSREFSGTYAREIFDALPECMTVLHICGNTTDILKEMAATGAEGLSLDTVVKFEEEIDSVSDSVLIGNVDPVRVMLDGTPEKVYENTLDVRKKMKGHEDFILSTGCDLSPKTPHENIRAFVEAGKAKNKTLKGCPVLFLRAGYFSVWEIRYNGPVMSICRK